MRKALFLVLVSTVLAAVGGPRAPLLASPGTPSGGPKRSNILLIVSDDQPRSMFDRTVDPAVFSGLVDKGVQFTRGYVSSSLCCPSRSEILTGLYERHTGVDANFVKLERPTIVEALHSLGYRTMLSGKYLNSSPCTPRPEFDRWVCGGLTNQVDPTLNIDGTFVHLHGYTSQIEARYAGQFIAETPKTQPFFVMYTPRSPHLPGDDPRYDSMPVDPWRAPGYDLETRNGRMPQYLQRDPIDPAWAATIDDNHTNMTQTMRALDDDIGSLLAALGSRARNTLVMFLSDNGYLFGDHRRAEKSVPYEESVNVPFVIRFPRVLPASEHFVSEALVQNVDVAPTIADLLGIHWGADGTSLMPILRREKTKVRDGALLEHCQGEAFPCYDRPSVPSFAGVVTSQYAYIDYVTGEKELYDLAADPAELLNVAGDPAYVQTQSRLATRMAVLRAPPPVDTTISGGPLGAIDARTARFTYFSQSRLAHYECRLTADGLTGQWENCDVQPWDIGPLPDGDYLFEVRGTDEQGATDATPDSRSFSIHSSGPPVEIIEGPPPEQTDGEASFTFTGDGNAQSFECSLSLAGWAPAWTACTEPGQSYSGLADGLWDFRVRETDTAGTVTSPPAEWTFRVDNVGPQVVFDAEPESSTTSTQAEFAFHPNEPTASLSCQVDAEPAENCIGGTLFLDPVAEGQHTLVVTGTDALGNVGSTSASWTVDLTAPVLDVISAPGSWTTTDSAAFVLSQDEDVTFTCSLDGKPAIICLEDPAFYALADGPHVLTVDAFDAAGNHSPAQDLAWTQDTVAPTVAVDAGPDGLTNQSSATLDFSSGDPAANLDCALDGAVPEPCTSPVIYQSLSDGDHSFEVVATDPAGNTATAGWAWTVDTVAPSVTISSGPADGTTETWATFEFNSEDPAALFTCVLDGGEPAPCDSPATYTDLLEGPHLFQVTPADPAGNVGTTASWAWTIEAGRPHRPVW